VLECFGHGSGDLAHSEALRQPRNGCRHAATKNAPMWSGNGATIASARSASMAWTTTEPTSAGDLFGMPMGAGKPVSAHIPASRIGPG